MNQKEWNDYEKNKKAKQGKFLNKHHWVDGIRFDSQKEANYYGVLKLRMKAGEIRIFERQHRFKIAVNGVHICTYVCDFVIHNFNGTKEIIDVKSDMTRKLTPYQMKKKLMEAVYNIKIKEV